MIIPGFGMISQVTSTFSRKTVFGYLGMVYAMITIGLIGFLLWAHHLFTVGMSINLTMYFTAESMVIAVHTGITVFSWLAKNWGCSLRFRTPLFWAIGIILYFSLDDV